MENDPQALGRVLVDFLLLGQTDIFFYKANFVNIHHRIKFYKQSLSALNLRRIKTFILFLGLPIWPPDHIFRLFFDNIKKNEAFRLILVPPVWPTEHIFHSFWTIFNTANFYNNHPRIKCHTKKLLVDLKLINPAQK